MSQFRFLKAGNDLTGKMKATVIKIDDPDKRGRIGVYIPRVMQLIDNFNNENTEKETSVSLDSKYTKDNSINGSTTIDSVNYLWAKPFRYGWFTKTNDGGDWRIPPLGATVIVEFIDGNPRDLYYMPFSPYDNDEGLDADPYNKDLTGSTELEVLLKSLKGSIIGFDSTDDNNKFFLCTTSGVKIIIDDKEKISISTKTQEDAVVIEKDTILVTAEKATVIASDTTIEGSNTLTIKSPDGARWFPNAITVCPITNIPHGGVGAGLTKLKSEQSTL